MYVGGKHVNEETYTIAENVLKPWEPKLLFKILDNMQEVVMVLDVNTKIVYVNKIYSKILGVPVDKIMGRRLDEIEPKSIAIETLRTGVPTHGRRDFLFSVGIDTVGSAAPIIENGKIVGCICIFSNVSELVKLDKELQRTKELANYFRDQLNEREKLPQSFKEYIGENKQLRETLNLAAKVARTDSTVLILGESGVGKGVLAGAIHNSSSRKDRHLIKVNCAAIPENLLESELFGYDEGAFSGAKKGGKLGKFELAQYGTIFLDEIGDMSLGMQAKLLRVLQEREIERVGGNKTIKLDIRVVAATNCNLESMVEKGTFRRDLYYRLNIVPIHLPPLRERKDDISLIADKFLELFSEKAGEKLTLSWQVTKILQKYKWPGNIRELQNVLEHASIVRTGTQIEVQHLPEHLRPADNEVRPVPSKPHDLKETVANVEREMIMAALAESNNNRSNAIRALGISRRAFYEKLQRYKIDT